MVQSIWQDKVVKSEHPTFLGEIPNAEKNAAVYFTEKRTISLLLNHIKSKMTWKPGTTVGVCLLMELTLSTFHKESICAERKLVPNSTQVDDVRRTKMTLDVLQESQICDC